LTVVLCCLGAAAAQIMDLREVDGKTITCTRTGLSSDLKDCGVRSNWYAYVLVGAISAISLTGKDEKEIQIAPQEVFHGNPPLP
jgi:hypothetical protein